MRAVRGGRPPAAARLGDRAELLHQGHRVRDAPVLNELAVRKTEYVYRRHIDLLSGRGHAHALAAVRSLHRHSRRPLVAFDDDVLHVEAKAVECLAHHPEKLLYTLATGRDSRELLVLNDELVKQVKVARIYALLVEAGHCRSHVVSHLYFFSLGLIDVWRRSY